MEVYLQSYLQPNEERKISLNNIEIRLTKAQWKEKGVISGGIRFKVFDKGEQKQKRPK